MESGKRFLRCAAWLLVAVLKQTPGVGAIIDFVDNCVDQVEKLSNERHLSSLEDRIRQLEETASYSSHDAKKIGVEVVKIARKEGYNISKQKEEAIIEILSKIPATVAQKAKPMKVDIKKRPTSRLSVVSAQTSSIKVSSLTQQKKENRKQKPTIPAGFSFLREASYTSGNIVRTVREFRHVQTGMEFVYIPGGSFVAGSPESEKSRYNNENQHKVTLTPYLIARYPCTQLQWRKIMGSNPSAFSGDTRPVEQVSWEDCQKFCRKTGLHLPTESQWEFACRAGSKDAYFFGSNESLLSDYIWYYYNSGDETHPVGQKKPNGFGLHDMLGNVWEWCQDWYGPYPSSQSLNPQGVSNGTGRVKRGGSWAESARNCRIARRSKELPSNRSPSIGLRLVKTIS